MPTDHIRKLNKQDNPYYVIRLKDIDELILNIEQWATKSGFEEESIGLACSDELTVLTTGTKLVFRLPYSIVLTDLRASLTTAGTTSGVTKIDIIDVATATSILGANKLTIDLGDKTSVGAATTPPDLPVSALADDLELSIDITALSGGATETGLKVWFKGLKR